MRFGATLLAALLCCTAGCRPKQRTICLGGPHCPEADIQPIDDDAGTPVVGRGQACAMQSVRAQRGPGKTVDVIFVVDNSSSMKD